MAQRAPFGRTIVIKARRDTVILVAAAVAMTFALSSVIHSRPGGIVAGVPEPVVHQAWTGALSAVSTAARPVTAEPMTSASLVLAKSELSLPPMNVRPLVKLRGCEDAVCASRATSSVPPHKPQPDVAEAARKPPPAPNDKPSLTARLNPLKHLPDMSVIGKPFVYAGDAVSGWFRHF